MDKGAWQTTVHRAAKSQTQLSMQCHLEKQKENTILTMFRVRVRYEYIFV